MNFRVKAPALIVLCLAMLGITGPVPTVQAPIEQPRMVKDTARGIFVLIKGDLVGQDVNLSLKNWTNPNTTGLRIRTVWDKVEPKEGAYDFSHFEQGLQLAHAKSKLLAISVSVGNNAPSWVYGEGAQGLRLTWSNGEAMMFPLPWDPVFKAKYSELVREMGARYDSDPALSYVVISGLGRDVETFFTSNAKDTAAFDQAGGLTAWEQAAKDMIDLYADAFPTTPIVFALGKPTTDPAGIETVKRVVDYGKEMYSDRFGIMSNALSAQSSSDYWINATINENMDVIRTGYQLVSPAVTQARMKGSLRAAMDIGVRFGAEFLEIYDMDTDNSTNAQDLQEINQTLLN